MEPIESMKPVENFEHETSVSEERIEHRLHCDGRFSVEAAWQLDITATEQKAIEKSLKFLLHKVRYASNPMTGIARWHRKQQFNYWLYRIFHGMSHTYANMQAFYLDL